MNLSFWEMQTFFKTPDLVIIGSGIVGLNAALAYKTKKTKSRVLVLERGVLPSGASTKNAGFACFGSASEVLHDLSINPEKEVMETIEMRYMGLKKTRKLLGDASIEFEKFGGYEVFDSKVKFQKCEQELSKVNHLVSEITGEKCTYKVDKGIVQSSGFSGFTHAIKNKLEGQLNTGKLMKSLIDRCNKMGIQILNGIQVTQIFDNGRDVELKISNDFVLRSRKVIVATNGFARKLLEIQDVEPARAQVLITEEIKGLAVKGSFHYNEGYFYFRNFGNRILFGGGRNLDFKKEHTFDFGLTEKIQKKLESILRTKILPRKKVSIEHRWSGIMGIGSSKKPIIKLYSPNVVCAVRMGGMGIAIGSVVGELSANLIRNS